MNNTKKSVFLGFIFITASSFLIADELSQINERRIGTHEIAEEIAKLKANDPYVKQYIKIKDPFIKQQLDYVQNAKLIAASREPQRIMSNFIKNALFYLRKGMVAINQTQCPKLYAIISELANKLNLKMPFIFITFDKKFYNAIAQTFSKNLTSILIGEAMINDMTDNELKAVIAHEFGHLVNDTVKCVSIFDRFLTPEIICITSILLGLELEFGCRIIFSVDKENNLFEILDTTPKKILFSVLAACPIILVLIITYTIWIKKHNPSHEVDADKVSIDITNDPESFVASMEAIKKQHTKEFENLENEMATWEYNLQGLKDVYESQYNEFNKIFTHTKNGIAINKKQVWDDGCATHPGINKRIEFGKQEIQKRKQQAELTA